MKKILILMFVLALAACSEEMPVIENESVSVEETVEQTPDLNMDSFISAFESEGITVEPEVKPAFGMIGASEGVIFYMNDLPVKIYEYHSEEAMATAAENFPMLNDWDKNGLFVLESSQDIAKEIFNSVE